ncbi:MAG TPA: hypothetical protein VKH64_16930 [Candidatus Binatia bacterium]|nr:hypothetical protein [Candidatus Binatia bacterium]
MSIVWTCIFHCFNCNEMFIVNRVSVTEIYAAQAFFPCPHCGRTAASDHPHRMIDLSVANVPFRRLQTGDVWHYSQYCSEWPIVEYIEIDFPPIGEICNECRALVRT